MDSIWKQPLLPSDYFDVVVQMATEHGITPAELLLNTEYAALCRSDELPRRMPTEAFALACIELMRRLDDRSLCCEAGLRMGPTLHGSMGLAIMCSASLEEAFELTRLFFATRLPGVEIQLTQESAYFSVQLNTSLTKFEVGQYFTELLSCCIYNACSILVGQPMRDVLIDWTHSGFDIAPRLRDQLPTIHFNQPALRLRIPMHYFNSRLVMPNRQELLRARIRCEQELRQIRAGESLSVQVQAVLRQHQASDLGLTQVARQFAMSERTFKRRLAEEGTSFRQLLSEHLTRRALLLLQDKAWSIEQIAAELGYASAASFCRAFKVAVGESPASYRKALGLRREWGG